MKRVAHVVFLVVMAICAVAQAAARTHRVGIWSDAP